MRAVLTIFIFQLISFGTFSQENKLIPDSTGAVVKKEKEHSPLIASTLSAIIPGAGQVYNKKIWKVPIVYAGLGAGVYFFSKNYSNYISYKDAFISRQDGNTNDQYINTIGDIELESLIQESHRYYELAIVGTLVLYVLNIVDASVDAHLFNFDVSNDLSMKVEPQVVPIAFSNKSSAGFSLKIQF